MSWLTDIQKVGNFANTQIQNGARIIKDTFSINIGNVKANIDTYLGSGGYNVVGIDTGKITSMKVAIRSYVEEINKNLAKLNNYDPSIAFKGTQTEEALRTYIDAVKEVCGNMTSHLLAFCDQLSEIEAAYNAKDSSNASVIKSSASTVQSAYTKYTEQYANGTPTP